MILNQRLNLNGNKEERIIAALTMAGWYEGRCVNIEEIEQYYAKNGFILLQAAKKFFSEFWGIASSWYIEFEYKKGHAPDFQFCLDPFPMSDPCKYEGYEDKEIMLVAKERFAYSGDIGYYYPAEVWIGESGRIYATHEYNDEVYTYPSVFSLILAELSCHDMMSVSMRR